MTVTSQRSLSLRRSSLVAPRAPTTIALKLPPRPRPRTHYRGCSHREPDLDDIAFCDHVVFAFEAHLAGRFGLSPSARFDDGLDRRHLGADESPFQIAVDLPRGLWSGGPSPHRPGVRLLGTDGEEGQEANGG